MHEVLQSSAWASCNNVGPCRHDEKNNIGECDCDCVLRHSCDTGCLIVQVCLKW